VLEPIGPLPAAVYWRRRAVALGGVIVMLFVLIWLVAATGGDNQVQPAAQELATTTTVPLTSGDASETSMTTSEATTSSSSVTTTTSVAPSPTPSSTPVVTTTPAGPQPCPDEITRVVAEPERQQYRVGERPVFRLSVTNTGTVPCVRDLDASLQELLVYAADGTTRLWSSNDCYPGDSNDVRTLQPGEPAMFSVTWAGRSSQPGCSGQRVAVPAGEYRVVGKLGPLTSAPTPFQLVN
jgi:hypothetical protein